MVELIVIGLAVLAGYIVAVGLILLSTMAIASAAPRFVVANHRVRGSYKLLHECMWFLSAMTGAFVTARIGSEVQPIRLELVLSGALLVILWRNTWEARQRGIAHQILITILTVAGCGGEHLSLHPHALDSAATTNKMGPAIAGPYLLQPSASEAN